MVKIRTQLCQDANDVLAKMGSNVAAGCDVVVLFSLGLEPASFVPLAKTVPSGTPVLLADCYGILGFSAAAKRNIELMEAGRGSEYGGRGGDGGQGVVAVVFSGEGVSASTDTLPASATAHMVVASSGSNVTSFLSSNACAVYHGGLAKATFQFNADQGQFEAVPYFHVSTASDPVGTTSFTSDAKGAMQTLLDQLPPGNRVGAVALFPCFMRGINEYGVNNIEPDALWEILPDVPIYGMFCHGELGPKGCVGFESAQDPRKSCRQHSMTSIVAMHALRV
jgi:hypothetical protein